MKVSGVSNRAKANENARRDSVPKSQSFSSSLDMANKDQTEQKLKDMLKNIEVAGKKLISTRSVEDAKEYKRKIQDYLSFIVKNIYVLKKEPGPFNYGVHVRIEVINKKLDELTKDIIQAQLETIEIADKIEEIRGLLIDAYK